MITSPSTARRLLIPRWRSFEATIAAGELAARKSVRLLEVSSPSLGELQKRRDNWHKLPSEVSAAELVESAIVYGQEEVASSAAQFLASVQADVTPLVRRQSQQMLSRLSNASQVMSIEQPSIRGRLRQTPDDAILWVELALSQIISGAAEGAARSMRTALQLAPNNRYVLRSAARLFSHLHEPDIGYYFLRKSSVTEYDPWLMAAEIAMASRIDRKAAFLRKGLSLLENAEGQPRLELSELAGAAATTYLDGNVPKRQAKHLFAQSLSAPTHSAVAQAEWASQATGERFLDASRLSGFKLAKEAQALHAFSVGEYEASLKAAKEWIAEEQFSGRAHITAAAAANTLDDHNTAIDICTRGVLLDNKSPYLRNSLIFALASIDRITDAETQVADMRLELLDPISERVFLANKGLIALRKLRLSQGEELYRKAISGFRKLGHEHMAVTALAYFAREARRAGHPKAKEFIRELKAATVDRKHSVAQRLLRQMEDKPDDKKHPL